MLSVESYSSLPASSALDRTGEVLLVARGSSPLPAHFGAVTSARLCALAPQLAARLAQLGSLLAPRGPSVSSAL